MKSGIDPPVRNPTQSLVKELQLKSRNHEHFKDWLAIAVNLFPT